MELNKLTQGNNEFSQYYVEYQYLIAILNYDSNAKKAALKWGLSTELQIRLVYKAEEPIDFAKFMDLCMKLDYQIHIYAMATKCQTTLALP
jgi:hypothetical protein